MRFVSTLVLTTAVSLVPASLLAQQGVPINEPYIKGTGQTVPNAGAVAADGIDKNLRRRTPEERRQDRITNGICKGC